MIGSLPIRQVIGPRWLLAGTMLLGLASFGSGRGTLAYFTSTVSSANNQFTAGSIKLQMNGASPTGTITFDTATTGLIPGVSKYGYFTVDNLNADAVPALFNGSSNGVITITRTASTTSPSTTTNAAALDTRLNITLKDVGGTAAITSSATCASNWTAGTNVAMTQPANLTAATTSANRTALTSGTASTLATDSFTLAAGGTKKYCVQFSWPNDTNGSLDNPAQSGSNGYVITFTGASS